MTPSELIHAVEQADSAESLLEAVKMLAETHSPEAIPSLITVLGYNNPGAAVAAVDGLIAIGEPAVQPLLEQLDGYNYGARAWAIRALSSIGDPRGLNVLLEAAGGDFALSVRRAAARGLGNIHWQQMNAQEVPEAQIQAINTLLQASQDPEWIVRYAAIVGLQGLAKEMKNLQCEYFDQIIHRLEEMINTDETLAVQARAKFAQSCLVQ
ncbi:HEAT repeat domain-containing protein [Limnoraphis robusta]|uniref:HEAT repeat domain-containing protein n=1 Tax=Limnoraphis robusta CCNP1315 TaxID=3110306 RepID=A0ABU5U117_9CYAN|nr:HEAT repeat domain-containing protein [Limnoraphis robusta]MEA5520789.1 HEAT repeat domain-containing protein [Limnoraphis robusta CCNP1315]MEA5544448.1 HEAT repeat domain-containing protein [Limnoraphis robusta CCNP1324]